MGNEMEVFEYLGYLNSIKNDKVYNYLKVLYDYECKVWDKPRIMRFLKQEGYIPQSIEDLRYYIQENYFLKDKDLPIVTNLNGIEVEIGPHDFYKGYYTDIWHGLTLKQRAKIVNWHFNSRIKTITPYKTQLLFMPPDAEWAKRDSNGLTSSDTNSNEIYISFKRLAQHSAQTIKTLEHELTHLKQRMFVHQRGHKNNLDYIPVNKLDTYYAHAYAYPMQTISMLNNEQQKIVSSVNNLPWLLYAIDSKEIKAQENGFKWVDKILALNEKEFGADPVTSSHLAVIQKKYYHLLCLEDPQDEDFELEQGETMNNYLFRRKISKNREYLLKLIYAKYSCLVEKQNAMADIKQLQENSDDDNVDKIIALDKVVDEKVNNIDKIDKYITHFLKTGNKQHISKNIACELEEKFGE